MPLDTNKTKRAVKMISTFFGTLILFQDKEKEQGLSSKIIMPKKKKKKAKCLPKISAKRKREISVS